MSNPQVTPIPIPIPGHQQSYLPQQDPQAPIGIVAGTRNVSPSSASVSSAGEGSGRKMKRTGAKLNVRPNLQAPPWAISLLHQKATSGQSPTTQGQAEETESPILESPEPARIVSDIVPPETDATPLAVKLGAFAANQKQPQEEMAGKKKTLSQSARIQALQQSWAIENFGTSSSSSPGSSNFIGQRLDGAERAKDWLSDGISPEETVAPARGSRKRSLPGASQGGDPKRRLADVAGQDHLSRSLSDGTVTARPPPTELDLLNAVSGGRWEGPNAPVSSGKLGGIIPITRRKRAPQSDDGADFEYMSEPEDDDTEDESEPALAATRGTSKNQEQVELKATASGDRLYLQWEKADGTLESTAGALLPTNYTLWTGNSTLPYICPVRNCRNIFNKMTALGSHFNAKHKSVKFNDNLDGTLSFVDYYKKVGAKWSPPIIVSQRPLRGDEPPMPTPSVPGYKPVGSQKSRAVTLPTPQPGSASSSSAPVSLDPNSSAALGVNVPSTIGNNVQLSGMNLYGYVASQLSPEYQVPTERPDIRAVLKLPIKRLFPKPWILKHGGMGKIPHPLGIMALLIYLTGDPAPTPCSTCAETPDPSETVLQPCVVLSSTAPDWLKETTNMACCSCKWKSWTIHGWPIKCDFLKNLDPKAERKAAISTTNPYYRKGTSPKRDVAPPSPALPLGVVKQRSPHRRVMRHSAVTSKGSADASTSSSTPDPSAAPSAVALAAASNPSASTSAAALASAGNQMPAEMLEMEDWEIAPGRVRDERSTTPTNVAFSNAYLTTNQAVTVSEDVAFNVIVIKPGSSYQWSAEDDRLRICSVAVGKVKVKLDSTEPFQMGPNGMFKLKPGAACTAENRVYIDTMIHVTSVNQY